MAIGVLVTLAFSAPVFAQRRLDLQFGVRAGAALTGFLETDTPTINERVILNRAPVIAGPTFEAVLYNRFLLQLDAMYRPIRVLTQGFNPTGATFETRGASFEFPVIFDYYFSKGKRRPYAGFGMVAARIATGTLESHVPSAGVLETPFEGQFFFKSQLPAYVLNGGMEWNTPWLAIRPELRYTRWNEKRGLEAKPNQVEVSVAFSMRRNQ